MYLLIYAKYTILGDKFLHTKNFNSLEEMNNWILSMKIYNSSFKVIKKYKIEKEID